MNRVLLVFPYNLVDKNGMEKIINDFESKGYDIHEFNDIGSSNFYIDILPAIVETIKEESEGIEKIVVLSNIKVALFTWYRCYNSLVDDFIYFIDKGDTSDLLKDNPNQKLFLAISSFDSISFDPVEGKIYTNISFDNYTQLFKLLIADNVFSYFNSIEDYDFYEKVHKKKNLRTYTFYEQLFRFPLGAESDDSRSCCIYIKEIKQRFNVNIDMGFVKCLNENAYFVPYVLIELYKKYTQDSINFLSGYMQYISAINIDKRTHICREIVNFIDSREHSFREKAAYLSFLVWINPESQEVLKRIISLLIEDNTNTIYHYHILISTLFFITQNNLKIYDDYYLESRAVLQKIISSNYKGEGLKPRKKTNEHRIAIVVDQLIGLNHSPTKLLLDYVKNLKKMYPGYQIKLFVEDDFVFAQEETILPVYYKSVPSDTVTEQHLNYLDGMDIQIYYLNTSLPKKEKVRCMVREIGEFDPEVILTTCVISISLELLYPSYPIIYLSLGGISYSRSIDVYLQASQEHKKAAIENNIVFRSLESSRIHDLKWGIILPEPRKKVQRSDYGINDGDFVMVMVGNRLDAEVNEEFVDLICSFLGTTENARLIIVGQANLIYLNEHYKEIMTKRILRIGYENDLPALYEICDVYVNPFRAGGGFSIAMAMKGGLPVVALNQPFSAAVAYMGDENCLIRTNEEYLYELRRLCSDCCYRREQGVLMKSLINRFTYEESFRQLFEYIDMAKESFNNRKHVKGKEE